MGGLLVGSEVPGLLEPAPAMLESAQVLDSDGSARAADPVVPVAASLPMCDGGVSLADCHLY